MLIDDITITATGNSSFQYLVIYEDKFALWYKRLWDRLAVRSYKSDILIAWYDYGKEVVLCEVMPTEETE